ncbi:MAG TPA: hypothetical protein VKR61_13665 [Bryobacteraceae bacterium]|nr:hypothetical protein [Bryobacteraceae bacterium]
MPQPPNQNSHRRPITVLILLALALSVGSAAFGQQLPPPEPEQQYVGKFLIYTGYMFLDSPKISLFEPGIHVQAGMRWSRHISVGFDYSRGTGSTSIGLNQATTALQNEFNPILAGLIAAGILPSSYVAKLPFSSVTQTFTMGPEFPWRRFKRITPYIRPSAGIINEMATAHPPDHVTQLVVNAVAPSGKEEEWTAFYGFGGGCAFNITKHFSLVVQADLVHDHLFPDLLKEGRNTVRFSVGPGVQFGHNVTRKWGLPGHWE